MKKVFAFTLVMLLSSFILLVPASAENIETTAFFKGENFFYAPGEDSDYDLHLSPEWNVDIPRQGNNALFTANVGQYYDSYWKQILFSVGEFSVTSDTDSGFYGDIGFYLSYYAYLNDYSSYGQGDLAALNSIWTPEERPFSVTIRNGNDEVITQKWFQPEFFYPEDYDISGASSPGIHYAFTINVPEETPILKISFGEPGFGHINWHNEDPYIGYKGRISYIIPSATLIADRTSAELQELQNITNILIEQNNITNEYYGEIISKVDDLYTEVGNLADLQQEAIDQFDNWNIVSSVPSSVTDKTDQAEDVLDELHQLEKPDPDQIVPELDTDTTEIAQILEPYFQNTLILQILMMTLGFAFVSYVLFGKKG